MEETTENTNPAEEVTGNPESGQNDQINGEITAPFDSALGNHIERLLGTREGIETLPMNLFTVSCLVLIATRETEIESFPYLPPERYDHKGLLKEMSDISFHSDEELESGIQSMIEKGYIEVADDGRFFAGEPTISMAKLIDRVFPTMPGLNLVAYLGQMIDEAFAGRKEIDVAVSQFNQMLEMHGVPIHSEPEPTASKSKPYPHLKAGESPPGTKAKGISSKGARPANIFSQLQTKTYVSTPSAPDIPAFEDLSVQETTADQGFDGGLQNTESQRETDSGTHEDMKGMENEIPAGLEPIPPASDSTPEQMNQEIEAVEPTAENFFSPEEREPVMPPEEGDPLHDDEDVEKKIAAFEEELGMTCPLCRNWGIQDNKTAKGKIYYHCTNPACNFISWGKPYYIACPKCSNPFLIEASKSTGETILKCPRATCHHWQEFPWEGPDEGSDENQEPVKAPPTKKKARKKVKRRRRVVRRKR